MTNMKVTAVSVASDPKLNVILPVRHAESALALDNKSCTSFVHSQDELLCWRMLKECLKERIY